MKDFEFQVKEFKKLVQEFKFQVKDFKIQVKEFKKLVKDFKFQVKDFKIQVKEFKKLVKDFKTPGKQSISHRNSAQKPMPQHGSLTRPDTISSQRTNARSLHSFCRPY